jgi:hypothetical protein
VQLKSTGTTQNLFEGKGRQTWWTTSQSITHLHTMPMSDQDVLTKVKDLPEARRQTLEQGQTKKA